MDRGGRGVDMCCVYALAVVVVGVADDKYLPTKSVLQNVPYEKGARRGKRGGGVAVSPFLRNR